MTVVLFWISALLLAYTYLGYPILIRVWARLRPRPARSRPIEPSLTVVVVAHDEAARIGTRIRNLLASDYPDGRLEILVGSDGSTDGTAERARAYERPGVRVLAFGLRRGKAAVLNDLVPQARGEIVVLTDARQQFEPGTLRALVAPLADPEVGAVGGDLILTRGAADTTVGEGIGAYWRYEKWMRACESRVDSSLGASGAIYAIRRDLFEPLREDTLLDDVLIPLHMVRRGRRVLFEPRARAFDRVASTPGEEFRRKVRTLAGNFQMFAREHWVLDPRRNRLWLQTVSHKGLRLLGPPLLAALFGSNAALAGSPIHRMIFVLQIGFYAAAAAGGLLRRRRRVPQALGLPYAFCLLNAAVVVAAWRFLSGRQCVAWEKSASAGPVRRGESSIGAASACPARWSRGRYMDWRPPPRSWPASRSAHRPGDLCNEGSQSPDSGQG